MARSNKTNTVKILSRISVEMTTQIRHAQSLENILETIDLSTTWLSTCHWDGWPYAICRHWYFNKSPDQVTDWGVSVATHDHRL